MWPKTGIASSAPTTATGTIGAFALHRRLDEAAAAEPAQR